MSELELSLLRARSMEALKQKARRGELFFTVAVGYVKVGRDKIEMDPDLRVREAIGLVFTRFAEMQSIRQVFLSLRSDQIALPYLNSRNSGQRQVLWKLPVYATVSNLLTNPVYAGAYAFGRTGSRTIIENGRKRIVRGRRKDRSDWAVLLVDHHEGYLSWAEFERNQRLIADNANGKGMLNRMGKRTGRSNGWTQSRVRGFRNTHDIAVYRDGEWAERGEVTLTEAASILNLSPATVLRQIRAGIIPAQQYCMTPAMTERNSD